MDNADVSRRDLALHRIFFFEDFSREDEQQYHSPLPDHVGAVREALLMFNELLPPDLESRFEKEVAEIRSGDRDDSWMLRPPNTAYIPSEPSFDHDAWCNQVEAAKSRLEKDVEVAEAARKLRNNAAETEWNDFWRSTVFAPFSNEAKQNPKYT